MKERERRTKKEKDRNPFPSRADRWPTMELNTANQACGLQAECTMLFLRNHFGHPLHGPIQNVLSSLVVSIEQPSHNSPELWSWLTASISFSLSLSGLCASAETAKQ